jgi:aryl-alcohol dehydrogenase-like predicted oxidoreductase
VGQEATLLTCVQQLHDNIRALDIKLTKEEIHAIEGESSSS